MHCVFVKHYLTRSGVDFFNTTWFPAVQKAIQSQPGFIKIIAALDLKTPGLVHITLYFDHQMNLLAWAGTEKHDELVDNLDDYRVRAWEFAVFDVADENEAAHCFSKLEWQSVTPKKIIYQATL